MHIKDVHNQRAGMLDWFEADGINQWSYGKVLVVEVKDYYLNPKTINWRGRVARVADYEMFATMVASWVKGDKVNNPMSKDDALDTALVALGV